MSVILLLDKNGEYITNEQLYCVEPDCLGEPWCAAWGICSETKAKNLEIHQEEPTTSENILDNSLKLTSFLRKLRSHRWIPSPMFLLEKKYAGIPGYKTNHSLRATAATRFYQAGVDEQLIMEKTGHKSLEGLRIYKRTNMEQHENLSDIMSATKRPAIQSWSASVSSDTACQSIFKTKSTQLSKEITIKTQETFKHMITLKNCNNVSIQVNLK